MNKIAVCLSGYLEHYYDTASSIHTLSPYEDTEVFIHTWNNLRSNSKATSVYPEIPKITDLYNPTSLYIEDFYEVSRHRFDTFPNKQYINSFINDLYKLKACYELFHREEGVQAYKALIQTGANILFTSGIPEVELYIADKNYNIVYMPQSDFENFYGSNVAFGSIRAMRVFSHCIDHVDVLYEDGVQLSKEELLKAHLQKHNITVLPSAVTYTLKECL